jgi:hypothetical protein
MQYLPLRLNVSSLPLVEFIIFFINLSQPLGWQRVLPLCAYSPPFDNELIKHKPRVDAMHEIKIRVLHKLYQQVFKATMLNKMSKLQK